MRVGAPLLVGAFVLAACSAPSTTRAPGSDNLTRSAQPGGQPAVSDGQPESGGAGQTSPSVEAAAAPPRPAQPEVTAPVGLDIGQRAPSFTVTGLDGRQISDADLRAQGKPYILYFHATW